MDESGWVAALAAVAASRHLNAVEAARLARQGRREAPRQAPFEAPAARDPAIQREAATPPTAGTALDEDSRDAA